MKNVQWEQLKRTEFEQYIAADAVVIIPVGATEQHGRHLPVNTDTSCCYAIARAAAERIEDVKVLVLPPIWTGYSPHHMQMAEAAGTISLGFHTFADLLTDVAACVYAHGFRRIMFLNGHGGNTALVQAVRFKLGEEKQISSVHCFTYWTLPDVPELMQSISETDKGHIGHAGEFETSLQLLLQPDLVDMSVARWAGTLGDPTTATAEKGGKVFEAVVTSLMNVIRRYHAGEYEDSRVCRKVI
ncbi:MAG: creatininase family protein [Dehalococcoidia bacterium]|jgi:creatinine amidohydrolase|nr:creatininase family protein [Dehalococcoidia bacterium]